MAAAQSAAYRDAVEQWRRLEARQEERRQRLEARASQEERRVEAPVHQEEAPPSASEPPARVARPGRAAGLGATIGSKSPGRGGAVLGRAAGLGRVPALGEPARGRAAALAERERRQPPAPRGPGRGRVPRRFEVLRVGRARAPPRAGRLAGAHAAALRGGGPRGARPRRPTRPRRRWPTPGPTTPKAATRPGPRRADAAAAANDRARRERVRAATPRRAPCRAPARQASRRSRATRRAAAPPRRRRGERLGRRERRRHAAARGRGGRLRAAGALARGVDRAALAAAPPDEAACCPICRDALGGDVVEMPCRWLEHEDRAVPHAFHRDCALELLNASASRGERVPRCPTCRDDFPPHLLVAHPEDL